MIPPEYSNPIKSLPSSLKSTETQASKIDPSLTVFIAQETSKLDLKEKTLCTQNSDTSKINTITSYLFGLTASTLSPFAQTFVLAKTKDIILSDIPV
ncbi:MAG: hypothetical protein V4489_00295, partial [Chlamydiota bacterium]